MFDNQPEFLCSSKWEVPNWSTYSRERDADREIGWDKGQSRARNSALRPDRFCRCDPPPSTPHASLAVARQMQGRAAPGALRHPSPLEPCPRRPRSTPAPPPPPQRTPPSSISYSCIAPPPIIPPIVPRPHRTTWHVSNSEIQRCAGRVARGQGGMEGAWWGERSGHKISSRKGGGEEDGGGRLTAAVQEDGGGRRAGSGGRKRSRGAEGCPLRHSVRNFTPRAAFSGLSKSLGSLARPSGASQSADNLRRNISGDLPRPGVQINLGRRGWSAAFPTLLS